MNIINDAGEKIGGAKKDKWKTNEMVVDDLDSLNLTEQFEMVKKDHIWHKPDYKKLIEDGMDKKVAYCYKIIRDRIPVTSQVDSEEARKQYISLITAIRNRVLKSESIEDLEGLANILTDRIFSRGDKIFSRGSSLPLVENDMNWEFCEAIEAGLATEAAQRSYRKSISDIVSWLYITYTDKRKIDKMIASGWPETVPAWKRGKEVILYEKKNMGWIVINKKREILSKNHESKEEAEEWMKKTYEENKENRKLMPKRPHLENIEIRGDDHRQGVDINSDNFVDELGFKGVEFGNWVANDERQQCINMAYDSLYDLAQALDIPVTSLSLDGELSLAFGSRGSGTASAHYEADRRVINLTKMNGAGSLAHEWAHAMDNYFGYTGNETLKGEPVGGTGWRSWKNNIGQTKESLSHLSSEEIKSWHNLMDVIRFKIPDHKEIISGFESQIEKTKKDMEDVKKTLEKDLENPRVLKNWLKKADDWVSHLERKIRMANEDKERGHFSKENKVSTDYYKRSESIIAGKNSYWIRPNEMFARAFECYINDKIMGNGNINQYLVSGVGDGQFSASTFKGDPYPSGKERMIINEAIEEFMTVMTPRLIETDLLENDNNENEPLISM